MNQINKAIEFAFQKHKGQFRKNSRIPYAYHPVMVANILSLVTNDKNIIIAGILHDTIEDCGVTFEEIKEKFGQNVAKYVMEVTKINGKDEIESKAGIMIKCADTLHNMSDCKDKKYIKKKLKIFRE